VAGYNDESPASVADGIEMAAGLLARVFDRMDGSQRSRPCTYNFPEPNEVTIEWVGRHTIHEARHHLADMERGLQIIASR